MPLHIELNEKIVRRPNQFNEITSIHFGKDVQSIVSGVFNYCHTLKTVTFDKDCKTTSIGNKTFANCTKLESITLPNSLQTIDEGAFEGCKCLQSVDIADSVQRISQLAFRGCNSLTELNLPKAKINDFNFSNAGQITQKQLNEFKQYLGLEERCTIKVEGQTIDNNAKFEPLEINKKDVVRSGIIIKGIANIHFGKDVESINPYTFQDFPSLGTVTFEPGCKITSIESGTFNSCYKLRTIALPDGVETVGNEAFASCQILESITLPDSVKTIANKAFYNCLDLKTVTIGKNISTIKERAFEDCYLLTELNLPKAKINGLDFSKPDQITQQQLNEFKQHLGLKEYCNIRVAKQILEPDSNAKIQQCKAILVDNRYSGAFKTVITSQLAYSYYKTGKFVEASTELKTLTELETQHLANCPEWKKQCEQNRELVTMNKVREKMINFGEKAELVSKYQRTLHEVKKASSNVFEKIDPKDKKK